MPEPSSDNPTPSRPETGSEAAETAGGKPVAPKLFEVPLTVRFQEADPAGIAFFSRAFEYAHVAEEALLREIGCAIDASFRDRATGTSWGLPIVRAEADYRRPCPFGEPLIVAVAVHRLGSSSITFRFTIHAAGDPSDVRVTVTLTQAIVDLDPTGGIKRRQPDQGLPANLLAGLRRLGLLDHLDAPGSGPAIGG